MGLVSPRMDSKIYVYSVNFPEEGVLSFDIKDDLQYNSEEGWLNFIKGEVLLIQKNGYDIL